MRTIHRSNPFRKEVRPVRYERHWQASMGKPSPQWLKTQKYTRRTSYGR